MDYFIIILLIIIIIVNIVILPVIIIIVIVGNINIAISTNTCRKSSSRDRLKART